MKNIYRPFQPTLTQEGLGKLGLTLEHVEPSGPLKGIVRAYLQIRCEHPTPYPVMPDGTQAIYMSPLGSMVGGAQTASKNIQLLQPGEYFGVWFFPAALRHFFTLDLSEIVDQIVGSEYLGCKPFNGLHEQVYRCKDFLQRAEVCEQWLMDNYSLTLAPQFDDALSIIYQSSGNERIGCIAKRIGWSSRHLNRFFLQHTGVGTKAFSNIVRAQSVCRELFFRESEVKNGSVEFGYYDQAHLIKSFQKHFKSSPSQFMSDFYNR